MSEEMKFQKLSEVELVEEASENAHPLIEEDGQIKRAKGGLSGAGIPVFDLTPYIMRQPDCLNTEAASSGLLMAYPTLTEEEVNAFLDFVSKSPGVLVLHLDATFMAVGDTDSNASYIINQLVSTQVFDSGEADAEDSMRGVMMHGGIADIFVSGSAGGSGLLSLVGFVEGEAAAQFVLPLGLVLMFPG